MCLESLIRTVQQKNPGKCTKYSRLDRTDRWVELIIETISAWCWLWYWLMICYALWISNPIFAHDDLLYKCVLNERKMKNSKRQRNVSNNFNYYNSHGTSSSLARTNRAYHSISGDSKDECRQNYSTSVGESHFDCTHNTVRFALLSYVSE